MSKKPIFPKTRLKNKKILNNFKNKKSPILNFLFGRLFQIMTIVAIVPLSGFFSRKGNLETLYPANQHLVAACINPSSELETQVFNQEERTSSVFETTTSKNEGMRSRPCFAGMSLSRLERKDLVLHHGSGQPPHGATALQPASAPSLGHSVQRSTESGYRSRIIRIIRLGSHRGTPFSQQPTSADQQSLFEEMQNAFNTDDTEVLVDFLYKCIEKTNDNDFQERVTDGIKLRDTYAAEVSHVGNLLNELYRNLLRQKTIQQQLDSNKQDLVGKSVTTASTDSIDKNLDLDNTLEELKELKKNYDAGLAQLVNIHSSSELKTARNNLVKHLTEDIYAYRQDCQQKNSGRRYSLDDLQTLAESASRRKVSRIGNAILKGIKSSTFNKTLNLIIKHSCSGRVNFPQSEKTDLKGKDIIARLPGWTGDRDATDLLKNLGKDASINVINLINKYADFIMQEKKEGSETPSVSKTLFDKEVIHEALAFRTATGGTKSLYDTVATLLATSNEFRANPFQNTNFNQKVDLKIKIKGELYHISNRLESKLCRRIEGFKNPPLSPQQKENYKNIVKEYTTAPRENGVEIHHLLQYSRGGPSTPDNALVVRGHEHGLCHFMECVQRLYIVGKPVFSDSLSMATRGVAKKLS